MVPGDREAASRELQASRKICRTAGRDDLRGIGGDWLLDYWPRIDRGRCALIPAQRTMIARGGRESRVRELRRRDAAYERGERGWKGRIGEAERGAKWRGRDNDNVRSALAGGLLRLMDALIISKQELQCFGAPPLGWTKACIYVCIYVCVERESCVCVYMYMYVCI